MENTGKPTIPKHMYTAWLIKPPTGPSKPPAKNTDKVARLMGTSPGMGMAI